MKWLFHILLFCLLILPFIIFSQNNNANFTRFGIYQGLSENEITSITQDDLGFLWIGTTSGLNRYDGYTFKTFSFIKKGDYILSSYIKALLKDNSGKIWIGTNDGLQCFDPQTESFTHYQQLANNNTGLIDNFVNCIYQNNDNEIWIGTQGGLSRFNLKYKTFSNYKPCSNNQNLTDKECNNILSITSNNGILYIGTNFQVLSFDIQKETFKPFQYNKNISARALSFYNSNTLLIGTYGYGLLSLDITTNLFTRINKIGTFEMSDRTVNAILQVKDGIFLGTENIGLIFTTNLNSNPNVFNYKKNNSDPSSISSNFIHCLFYDKSGNLWAGTQQDGLCKLNIGTKPFKNYMTPIVYKEIHSPPAVRSFLELDKNTVLLGTLGSGILLFNRETDSFAPVKYTSGTISGENVNRITTLLNSKKGYIWIGTEGAGLIKGKLSRQKTGSHASINIIAHYSKNINNKKLYIPSDYILSILEDSHQNIWVGTWVGLILFQPDIKGGYNLQYYTHNPKDMNTISNNQVFSLYEDSKGILWAGTRKGLNKIVLQKNGEFTFKNYYVNSKENPGLICDYILSIKEDTKNDRGLWIGTRGGGISYFNREPENFISYSIDKKIGNSNISGILQDSKGNFWVGTSKGILMFDIKKTTFYNYYENADNKQYDFNLVSSCIKTTDNEFYFGNTSGFTSFNPNKISQRTFVPEIVITGLNIQNKPVPIGEVFGKRIILKKSISYYGDITLKHNESAFAIEFASLDYYSPDKIKYAYKLKGFDNDWIYTNSDNRKATYSNLRAGTYIFYVNGTNSDGIWNPKATSLQIKILPPWWNTWLARILYFIIIASAISFYIRYRIKLNILKNNLRFEHLEKEKLNEVHQMKLRFFAYISHEFRTPLTLITAPLEKLYGNTQLDKEMKYQIEVMRNNINRLLRLINQILYLTKAESDQIRLNPKTNDVVEYIKVLISSFYLKAEQQAINLTFSSDPESYRVSFDHDILEKIVYNLLSNAFNHTPNNGSIEVSFRAIEPEIIELRVKDTGTGIPLEQQEKIFEHFFQADNNKLEETKGTGLGLSLVKTLVDTYKGTIEVNSKPNQGSEFIIKLPVIKPTFNDHSQTPGTNNGMLQSAEDIPGTSTSVSVKAMLVVEDNNEMRKYICKNFEQEYKIFEAHNGIEGLSMARKKMPDIIISDVMMPGMNGMEFCKKIKTDVRTSHIPVLMLTAVDSDESRTEGIETGADSYLTKPFNIRHLEASVKALIASREKLRAIYSQKLEITPSEVSITSTDEKFLHKLIALIENKMNEPDFNIESICEELSISRTNLHRKIKALTGQTSSEFLRTFRIKRAGQLLQSGMNVTEAMYEVGINSRSYFIKNFKEIFGVLPSEYPKK